MQNHLNILQKIGTTLTQSVQLANVENAYQMEGSEKISLLKEK
jgi:hypothetical protein